MNREMYVTYHMAYPSVLIACTQVVVMQIVKQSTTSPMYVTCKSVHNLKNSV